MIPIINIAQAGVITAAPRFSEIGLKALSFLLSVFGVIAIIGIAVSGVMYLTSSGDEKKIEKAKKAFVYSVYGIAAALGAIVIIKQVAKFFE